MRRRSSMESTILIAPDISCEHCQRAIAEIHRALRPGGRFLLADLGRPEGLLLKTFFALGALLQSDEARYIQDNQAGRLPLFLEEAGFAVQELPPRYRGAISPGNEAGSSL